MRLPLMRRCRCILLIAAIVPTAASVRADEYEDVQGFKTEVSYANSSTVYLKAGSDDGLQIGDIVEIARDGKTITTVVVKHLSKRRAACSIRDPKASVLQGDEARFVPHRGLITRQTVAPATIPAARPRAAARRRSRRSRIRDLGIRGRVGIRYLGIRDSGSNGSTVSQPALDIKATGTAVAGTPLGFSVDTRMRRSYRSDASGEKSTHGRTRIYRLSAGWNDPDSPFRWALGRQFVASVASVSIFDGVSLEYRKPRWSLGAFSGSQPDAVDFGYSSKIREHGIFAERRSDPGAKGRWSLSGAAVGSYDNGSINREFLYFRGSYATQKLSAHISQEIDYNRGWRADAENSAVSSTSTFLNVRYRPIDELTLNAGWDNRRNIRLHRDRISPETEFDDSYRLGAWIGANYRFFEYYRVGVRLREGTGGASGSSHSYTLSLAARNLTRLDLRLRTRLSRYANIRSEGSIQSLSLGFDVTRKIHCEISGGLRTDRSLTGATGDSATSWFGLDLDYLLARRLFLIVSLESNRGDGEGNDQIYSSLSYRF